MYVTGTASAGAVFGLGEGNATTLPDSGVFLARYTGNGTFVSATRVASGEGRSVAVDQQRNIYLASDRCFVAKFDPAVTLIWSKQFTSTVDVLCNDIAVDGQQNSFITGGFRQDATFDHTVLQGPNNDVDIFLVKYTAEGDRSFTIQAGGTWTDEAFGVAVDGEGSAYITGFFQQTAVFGNAPHQTSLTAVSAPETVAGDLFVAKYAANGNLTWVRQATGLGSAVGVDVALEGQDNIYVAGFMARESDTVFGP